MATTERLGTWTIIALLLTMLVALVHAIAESQLAHTPRIARLFPVGWFES